MNFRFLGAVAASLCVAGLVHPLHGQPAGGKVPEVVEWISKSPADLQDRFDEAVAKGPRGIEALVEHLHNKEPLDADGRSTVTVFYNGFDEKKSAVKGEPRRAFQQRILKEWVKEYPASLYARLGEAVFWTSYAWDARGGGYASEVTEEKWKGFNERLGIARERLMACRELQEVEPMWSNVAFQIALGAGEGRAEFEEFATVAFRNFPEYEFTTGAAIYYLAPKWHGEPGEWEPWVRGKLKGLPEDVAARAYARMIVTKLGVWQFKPADREAMLGNVKIDKELLVKGLDLLREKYPDSPWAASGDAVVSRYLLEDPRRVAAALARGKGRVDLRVWYRKPQYTDTVDWLAGRKF